MAERMFEDGAVICRAGEPAEAVFRVRVGALLVEPAGGPLDRPYVLLVGEIFGAEALLAGSAYQATVRARGQTVLDVTGRAAVLAALVARPDAALPLVRAVFDQADFPSQPAAAVSAGHALRLVPGTQTVAEQIGADGVPISSFPFVVGRQQGRGEENGSRGVDLVLHDRAPYNLSRRHFAIDRDGESFVVRDCGSFHGTIVNGMLIGGSEIRRSATLRPGENAIIAGKATSPMRFSFIVA